MSSPYQPDRRRERRTMIALGVLVFSAPIWGVLLVVWWIS